jgi:Domain of unknown function (DUF4406)
MKVIFIAGPLTPSLADAESDPGSYQEAIDLRVWRAKDAALAILGWGAIPIVPHANTGWALGKVDEAVVRAGYRRILGLCDAVAMLDGWIESAGARGEHDAAVVLGIPIFLWPNDKEHVVRFIKGATD